MTFALTKSEAFEILEVVQGVGEDGSALIEIEQRLIDFVYQEATLEDTMINWEKS